MFWQLTGATGVIIQHSFQGFDELQLCAFFERRAFSNKHRRDFAIANSTLDLSTKVLS